MRFPVIILTLAVIAGCGDDSPTAPTTPTTPVPVTERFDAIIDLKGTSFRPFSVGATGSMVLINLASLSPLNRPGLLPVSMQIGYGTVVNDDDGNAVRCDLRKTVEAAAALTAQLTDTLTPATNYCVSLVDIGNLREAANFSIRITHP